MKMNSTTITVIISAVIIIGVGVALAVAPRNSTVADPALTALAKCLTDAGAKFYGAFWCPHCRAQKALFGAAAKDLPYVECSTSDAKGQTAICIEKKVTNYPTWDFPDGTRKVGEVTLAELAAATKCPLPGAASTATTTTSVGSSSSAVVQ